MWRNERPSQPFDSPGLKAWACLRPDPFGSERLDMSSSTCLKAELLRPSGSGLTLSGTSLPRLKRQDLLSTRAQAEGVPPNGSTTSASDGDSLSIYDV
jgi:hypothetical protein